MVRLASHANNTISWMILNKMFMGDSNWWIVRDRQREYYYMGMRKGDKCCDYNFAHTLFPTYYIIWTLSLGWFVVHLSLVLQL